MGPADSVFLAVVQWDRLERVARLAAPDHGYTATCDQRTGGLATLPVARKLARRC